MRVPLTPKREMSRPYWITPALAGTMSECSAIYHCQQDHPRACGYHFSQTPKTTMSIGSPPRLRVPCVGKLLINPWARITPALAGTISLRAYLLEIVWDHPRACGYHGYRKTVLVGRLGSPPRLRVPYPDVLL